MTQTTFLNAYRALEQGVRPRKPSNWLMAIASNAIKQRFREDKARPQQVELDESMVKQNADDDDGPSIGELLTALSKISPQQRQAIVLREFEGRSYVEIAEILGVTTSALETLLFRARRSLAEELEDQLTCTEAQLAVSKSVDGRLGRKDRRRLRAHLSECSDCAQFARSQRRHQTALRGLTLLPIPLSLSIFKGLEGAGTANAATLPAVAGGGSVAVGTGVVAASAGSGAGAVTAGGGGLFASGLAIKAAATVAAVSVAGGAAITGASELEKHPAKKVPAATSSGQRIGQVAPRGVSVPGNGVARGKATSGRLKKTLAAKKARASLHTNRGARHAKLTPAQKGILRAAKRPNDSSLRNGAAKVKPMPKSSSSSARTARTGKGTSASKP